MADFRYIVDHLRSQYDKKMLSKTENGKNEMVQGVRVKCLGEQAFSPQLEPGPPMVDPEQIAMPSKDEGQWDCPGAAKIGLPIVITKCTPGISWRGRKFDGAHAAFNVYHIPFTSYDAFDPSLPTNEPIHPLVCNSGSFIVVRQDKKPLHFLHVTAMGDYLLNALKDHANECHKTGSRMNLQVYLDSISKEGFSRSWNVFVEEHKDLCGYPVGLQSPYDV
jgi:hypothetical protein